jgi:hypothetical protein
MAEADRAGPTLWKLVGYAAAIADMMKDPAMLKLAMSMQEMIAQLDLGKFPEPDKIVTPEEAIRRIAYGDITEEEQRRFDRKIQESESGVG